ncbi:hypothetical protein [Bacteroides sp. 214]|uniref:hypothetical protein n=1 Tax=Bacteroides sp. 214 TaxID=2302935 RepID=UPI0013D08BBF|nr:hypothetical protein [Bacteroides sp. 214]
MLQTIAAPQELTGKQQADYCLLLSQAMDRNDLPLNDSLITIALTYYKDQSGLGQTHLNYSYFWLGNKTIAKLILP